MDTSINRRGLLGCMALAGAGVVWTVTDLVVKRGQGPLVLTDHTLAEV